MSRTKARSPAHTKLFHSAFTLLSCLLLCKWIDKCDCVSVWHRMWPLLVIYCKSQPVSIASFIILPTQLLSFRWRGGTHTKPVQNRNTMEMLYWVQAFNTCISLRLCRKVFLPDRVTCTNPTAWDYNLHPATIFGQDSRLFLCLFCEPCWLFQLCRLQSLRPFFFSVGCYVAAVSSFIIHHANEATGCACPFAPRAASFLSSCSTGCLFCFRLFWLHSVTWMNNLWHKELSSPTT